MQNHVIEGVWCPAISARTNEMETLGGNEITLSCNSSSHYVNNAKIIHTDHKASNGIVHHIDAVLVPEKGQIIDFFLLDNNKILYLIEFVFQREKKCFLIYMCYNVHEIFVSDTEKYFRSLDKCFSGNILALYNLSRLEEAANISGFWHFHCSDYRNFDCYQKGNLPAPHLFPTYYLPARELSLHIPNITAGI